MDQNAYIAWQFRPGLDAAAAFLAGLAVYVALDLVRRLPHSSGRAAWWWLLGSALALATGVWSVHFITLASNPLPFPIGYGGLLAGAGWLIGLAVCALALHLAFARSATPAGGGVAAGLMAIGAVASFALYLLDLRIAPAPVWRWPWLLGAALGLGVLLAGAGWLGSGARSGPVWRRALAAAIGGAALVAGQRVATLAVQVPFDSVSLNHFGAASDITLAVLATLGSGSLLGVLLLLSIIEARMRAALQAAIRRVDEAARTDALTQLPNRMHFDLGLELATRHADAQAAQIALLFIGVDGFKTVNDSFGRRVGDLLLQEMATRLRTAADGASIARAGGDEFVLLLSPNVGKVEAAAVAQRLLVAVAEPCDIEGRQLPMSCSIGVVLYPQDGNAAGAMARAEAAARYAKRNGGATFAFFEPRMLGDAREQVELLRDLRQAVARNEFELYYQPKIHAPSGEITGAEALLRWHHPQRGMVSPGVFIPIAERHGLIGTLGQWVIEAACRQARAWRDQGLRMRVAINLSVHQLRQPDLAERIAGALKAHQVNPQLLTCEITESVAMEDAEGTMRIFERLAAVGVNISIDDFGTGYSSLAYLRKLPAGELKIDRSFVLDLETSADARAVVDAVVKLAQALGLKVVAEGVETEAQNQILRSLGCDELQGYLFAKPMSAKALALWAMSDVGPRAIDFRESLFTETLPVALH
jgi:diguanylate cyclase (GGDEF)-like protein